MHLVSSNAEDPKIKKDYKNSSGQLGPDLMKRQQRPAQTQGPWGPLSASSLLKATDVKSLN